MVNLICHVWLLYNDMNEITVLGPSVISQHLSATFLLRLFNNCRETDVLYSTQWEKKEKEVKKGREFPTSLSLSLSPPLFPLSGRHSYLWEIRLETVKEKRGGAKSGRRVATHVLPAPLSLCIFIPHLVNVPSPLLQFLSWCHARVLANS